MHSFDDSLRLNALYDSLREKLLDLTKRNRMLNYSLGARSRKSLQLIDVSPSLIFERLAEQGSALEIRALDTPGDTPADEQTEEFVQQLEHAKNSDLEYLTRLRALESTGRDDELALAIAERELRVRLRETLGMSSRPTIKEINRSELARSRGINPGLDLSFSRGSETSGAVTHLQTLKFPDEIESTLELIAADARLAEQEMGLSTLFLSFGFLEWFDTDSSEKGCFAPLLLLPVRLERRKQSGRWGYYLVGTADSPEINLSLQKLLEAKFGRQLPNFEIVEDEAWASIEKFIEQANQAVLGLNRWSVRKWLVLGHFAFGRLSMYSDLSPENWSGGAPHSHGLIKAILQGTEDVDANFPRAPDDYDVDEPSIEKLTPYLIQDADASQQSALVDIMRGTNLVIQGPPGTGKSQTITNVIANAVAAGKTVLFLAEKRAALEVVKRRLDRCGLGDFCLELHSDKSSPKEVIGDLKKRSELAIEAGAVRRDRHRTLLASKQHLRSYLDALHGTDEAGEKLFDLIWRALRVQSASSEGVVRSLAESLALRGEDHHWLSSALSLFVTAVEKFESDHRNINDSAWFKLIEPTIDADRLSALGAPLRRAQDAIAGLLSHVSVRDGELRTLSDLQLLEELSLIQQLPPDDAILSQVILHDLDKLEQRVHEQVEVRGLSEELETSASVASLPSDLFDKAEKISSMSELDPLFDMQGPTSRLLAEDHIRRLPHAIKMVRALSRASYYLNIPGESNSEAFKTIVVCVQFAADITEREVHWFGRSFVSDEGAFLQFNLKRLRLLQKDAALRQRYLSFRYSPWPTARRLRSVAQGLKKGPVAKALSVLNSQAKDADELTRLLGYSKVNKDVVDDIEKLIVHVESYVAFWSDGEHQELFREIWDGEATPFREIEFGIKFRESLRSQLRHLPCGEAAYEKFISLNPAEIAELRRFKEEAAFVAAFLDSADEKLVRASIVDLEGSLKRRLLAANVLVQEDPAGNLAKQTASINLINRVGSVKHKYQQLQSSLEACGAEATRLAGADGVLSAISWLRCIDEISERASFRRSLALPGAKDVFSRLKDVAIKVAEFVHAVENERAALESVLDVDLFNRSFDDLSSILLCLIDTEAEANDAANLRRFEMELRSLHLSAFLDEVYRVRLPVAEYNEAFGALWASQKARQLRAVTPVLERASGTMNDAHRIAFAENDRAQRIEDRLEVRSILTRRPTLDGNNSGSRRSWTEMWMLKNEFQKQGRFSSVRTLVKRAPVSLQALKPCFMMSPLSLAKFVAPDALKFDLLIIDEASQMRPEDAFGALLRCKQVVVVGDMKQLPPTQFFNHAEVDDSSWDDDALEDGKKEESILESCYKSFGAVRQLKWHYRSRCESLIAFSNREFYDGSLITFPTARPGSFSVSLIRVDGTYTARRNVAEAARIAEEAIEFMRYFSDKPADQVLSLGIVALNVDQRELIQSEIHRLEAGDEFVERYKELVRRRGEEVFIKNLENVQGDERDFIFVSLTYGKELNGVTLKQRFGPINSRDGHRRLNVLFTRARSRVAVFSSFGSSDVTPGPQSNEGMHVLKRYLEYAERRGRAGIGNPVGRPDTDFEVAVAERLRRAGFEVDYQIGVSGYKIDLGIRSDDRPSRYIVGIECDGITYHSGKSARDRDRLREEVLNALGWKILRVWSTDWFANPQAETRKLVARIVELKKSSVSLFDEYPLRASYSAKATTSPEPLGSSSGGESYIGGNFGEVLSGTEALSEQEAAALLRHFRDEIIAKEVQNWESQRSLLRESMIEAFIEQRVVDVAQWISKIPNYQRTGTSQIERSRYLKVVCSIVARIKLDATIRAGENSETEFKSTLSVNLHTGKRDPKIEFTALRAIASLLNGDGGNLIIGVDDNREPLGLENDGFDTEDRMSLHLNSLLHTGIGLQHSPHLRISFEDYDGKRILVIRCSRARYPVYLKDGTLERFFMRAGSATRELTGQRQLDYVRSRFYGEGEFSEMDQQIESAVTA